MQKNWYVLYTKPKCEKKVASLLTKKKIENFCPINCKAIKQLRKSKLLYEPLFTSYVFANIEEEEISLLRHVENVVNMAYWKGKPAIIKNEEIVILKDFITNHQDIKLERTKVNINEEPHIIGGPSYSIDGQILMIKNKSVKVNLPSLGFTLIAEMQEENIMGREVSFGNKELQLQ